MNLSTMPDDRRPAALGKVFAWVAGILAVLTSIPALFARGLMGDDFSAYYVFWTEGAYGFTHWMIEVSHVGYTVPTLLFFYIVADTPNVFTRIAGLGCLCLSGILLYKVLDQSTRTRPVAALTTALFMVTPFSDGPIPTSKKSNRDGLRQAFSILRPGAVSADVR
jgi:hypothetical protein